MKLLRWTKKQKTILQTWSSCLVVHDLWLGILRPPLEGGVGISLSWSIPSVSAPKFQALPWIGCVCLIDRLAKLISLSTIDLLTDLLKIMKRFILRCKLKRASVFFDVSKQQRQFEPCKPRRLKSDRRGRWFDSGWKKSYPSHLVGCRRANHRIRRSTWDRLRPCSDSTAQKQSSPG